MNTNPIHPYGWRPQLPDHRDLRLAVAPLTTTLPSSADLSPQFPPCYDQGDLGSCTSNSLAAIVQFNQRQQRLPDFMPSRLFIYYNERVIEGTVNSDAGAELRDGIKALASLGVCREELWPYNPAKFAQRPPAAAYDRALIHKAIKYQAVPQNLHTLKSVIAGGQPIVFGFTAYESFESDGIARSGILQIPTAGEAVVGGHAVVAVGYSTASQTFKVRNSWSTSWGDNGYFHMPWQYILSPDLASDSWQVDLVGAG